MRILNLRFNKQIITLILALCLTTTSVWAIEEQAGIQKNAVLNNNGYSRQKL